MFLSNLKCITQPTLINLHLDKYSQELLGKKYDFIYNRIRHLIGEKSCITYVIPHFAIRQKVDIS